MRNFSFEEGGYYHVYNRGVDKRQIVMDDYDSGRFVQGLTEFNVVEPIGSIYENSFKKTQDQLRYLVPKSGGLVNIICYCLNPNHFHLLLQPISERGIEKFMHKLGLGYTNYFNKKHKRSGALFQGTFKAKHVFTDGYIQHLSAYINLNNLVHKIEGEPSKLVRSSWEEYAEDKKSICRKDIILDQFGDAREYKTYCTDVLPMLIENKSLAKELRELGFEE
ncbi:MAG: transposase [Candidatus Vogelbacteria bacterium]|nr:transposase [Candidatus Vogelbacteria bacterium]